MRKIDVRSGHVGYRHQLDRVRRFLERVEGPNLRDVEFQDMMWAFFQNCYHLRDWVRNDPLLPGIKKRTIIHLAGESLALRRSGDLCNGTKHLAPKPSAQHSHVSITITPGAETDIDCLIDIGGNAQISGKALARECVAEWERIFRSQDLPTVRIA
jgi:hypothetical protein